MAGCQNCFFCSRWIILRQKIFCKVLASIIFKHWVGRHQLFDETFSASFINSTHWPEKCPRFGEVFYGEVVKTAFYESRGKSWRNLCFWKKTICFVYSLPEVQHETFALVANVFQYVIQNCFLRGGRSFWRLVLRTIVFLAVSNGWAQNLKTFYQFLPEKL